MDILSSDILTTIVNIIVIGSMVVAGIAFFGRTIMKRFINSPEIKQISANQDEIKNTLAVKDKVDTERHNSLTKIQEIQDNKLNNISAKTENLSNKIDEHLIKSASTWAVTGERLHTLEKRLSEIFRNSNTD